MQSLQIHNCGRRLDAADAAEALDIAPATDEAAERPAWLGRASRLAAKVHVLANTHAVRALPSMLMQGLVL